MANRHLENNKTLWWFAGEDPYILSFCSKKTKKKLALNGLVVIIIMTISAISISFGIYEILESYYIGLIVGIYSAILIMFLYIFILYTLTKDVIPPKVKSKYASYSSRALRIGFLVFLGVLVSQPIEYELFSNIVNEELTEYIATEIENRNNKLNKEYALKLNELRSLNIDESTLQTEILRFNKEKELRLHNFIDYQTSRNFFVQKLIIMDSSPKTRFIWVFSLVFVIIFIFPVYQKVYIDKSTNYYFYKEKVQRKLISDHYQKFVVTYDEILRQDYSQFGLKWKSDYKDPPFNSVPIEDITYNSDKEFNEWLLGESH
ncbi:DUF4407 domain-containing protein [Winogradskyella sp. MH6]|uniref:DUF4407 domain-containing protein n=1 Tax=Winogradskyella sp. MH6 TaxID=2929510 RepID=UPI001FB2E295|nr:DUF4407 domain-containing protein [Winogradskyella sp. MH6]